MHSLVTWSKEKLSGAKEQTTEIASKLCDHKILTCMIAGGLYAVGGVVIDRVKIITNAILDNEEHKAYVKKEQENKAAADQHLKKTKAREVGIINQLKKSFPDNICDIKLEKPIQNPDIYTITCTEKGLTYRKVVTCSPTEPDRNGDATCTLDR